MIQGGGGGQTICSPRPLAGERATQLGAGLASRLPTRVWLPADTGRSHAGWFAATAPLAEITHLLTKGTYTKKKKKKAFKRDQNAMAYNETIVEIVEFFFHLKFRLEL